MAEQAGALLGVKRETKKLTFCRGCASVDTSLMKCTSCKSRTKRTEGSPKEVHAVSFQPRVRSTSLQYENSPMAKFE